MTSYHAPPTKYDILEEVYVSSFVTTEDPEFEADYERRKKEAEEACEENL